MARRLREKATPKKTFYIQRHRQGSERTVAVDTEGFIEFLADIIKNGWQFADVMNVNTYYIRDDELSERRLGFIDLGELWDIAERRVKKIPA